MVDVIPDIANSDQPHVDALLAQVGMTDIEVPLRLESYDIGQTTLSARADAFVSLDNPQAKGIHMSRLFILLQRHLENNWFEPQLIQQICRDFIDSHKELSSQAFVRISFDHPALASSLKTGFRGWRFYPVQFWGHLVGDVFTLVCGVRVTYSSTCPCSAALSRQLIQKQFAEDFPKGADLSHEKVTSWLGSEKGMIATPHGQRSIADIRFIPTNPDKLTITNMIARVESVLRTPVQAAVKREDEQEFARLNGTNLMFSEDAARRIQKELSHSTEVGSFKVVVKHFESLHPHNAAAVAVHPSWRENLCF